MYVCVCALQKGWPPLIAAAVQGHANVIDWLLDQPGVDVNVLDPVRALACVCVCMCVC